MRAESKPDQSGIAPASEDLPKAYLCLDVKTPKPHYKIISKPEDEKSIHGCLKMEVRVRLSRVISKLKGSLHTSN